MPTKQQVKIVRTQRLCLQSREKQFTGSFKYSALLGSVAIVARCFNAEAARSLEVRQLSNLSVPRGFAALRACAQISQKFA